MAQKRTFTLLFVIGLLALLLAACGAKTEAPVATQPPAQQETEAPPTATLEPTPEPTQPPSLVIEDVNTFKDTYDNYYVVGIVTNYYNQPASGIEIGLKAIGPDGNEIVTDTTYLTTDTIRPGDSAPFFWWTSDEIPDGTEWEVDVVSKDLLDDFNDGELDVINASMNWTEDKGNIIITGELINQSDQPVSLDALAAAVFDENGNILTATFFDVALYYYNPGDSGPFLITLSANQDLIDRADNYVVYVDAVVSDPVGPYAYELGQDDYTVFTNVYDTVHVIGEITNRSTETLDFRIVAGAYDADGTVLDADYLDLPLQALAPDATTPFDLYRWYALETIPELRDRVDHYVIQVDPYWTLPSSIQYTDIAVQNIEIDKQNGYWDIDITLHNGSGNEVTDVLVFAQVRDPESGKLLAVEEDSLFEPLKDGEAAPFSLTLYYDPELDMDALELQIIAFGVLP